jgi:hypothetical protein
MPLIRRVSSGVLSRVGRKTKELSVYKTKYSIYYSMKTGTHKQALQVKD